MPLNNPLILDNQGATMSSSHYLKPGIAAIVLALLFPVYWTYILVTLGGDIIESIRHNIMTLHWSDALFVLIGALEVYLLLSLAKVFADIIDSKAIRILLLIMAASSFVFHFLVVVDLVLATSQISGSSADTIVNISLGIALAVDTLFVLAGLVLAILLLANKSENSNLIRAFAIILLLICLFDLTFFLSLLNLALYPVALIVLAVYFLKEPQTVEVV